MNCQCISVEDKPFREQLKEDSNQLQTQSNLPKKTAPFGMKFLNALGLKQYVLGKFVFKRSEPKYQLKNSQTIEEGKLIEGKELYLSNDPIHLDGFMIKAEILERKEYSIPVVWIRSKNNETLPTIVYSHGNSSDIADAFIFAKRIIKALKVNIVIYDYTGYGVSNLDEVSEESLINDLEVVLEWLHLPKSHLILWGFSLGSYPTVSVGAQGYFGGVILQSPLASAACFFDSETPESQKNTHHTYDFDCLDNLKSVAEISGPILLFHSQDDEIIPIFHALKLYSIIKNKGKCEKHCMVEVEKLKHNQMHYFLSDDKQNALNSFLKKFVNDVQIKITRDGVKTQEIFFKSARFGSIKNVQVQQQEEPHDEESEAKTDESWVVEESKPIQASPNKKSFGLGTKKHKVYFAMRNYAKEERDEKESS